MEETPLELTDFLMGMLEAGKELRFNLPRKWGGGGEDGGMAPGLHVSPCSSSSRLTNFLHNHPA